MAYVSFGNCVSKADDVNPGGDSGAVVAISERLMVMSGTTVLAIKSDRGFRHRCGICPLPPTLSERVKARARDCRLRCMQLPNSRTQSTLRGRTQRPPTKQSAEEDKSPPSAHTRTFEYSICFANTSCHLA